jgi:hypothetical protein|tara:strand:- start:34 stop:465 length:432 start_codon:yes stop_codon:yes gene_type:complete
MAIIYTNQSSGSLRRTKKKMKNLSSNQISKFEEELRVHNKFMKQKGIHSMLMTLDEYIKYRFGQSPKVKTTFVPLQSVPHVRETPEYPSLSNSKNMGNGGTIDHKTQMERIAVSKQYSIVPAYNKGPYMVVSKEDLKTAGRKV